MRYLLFIVLVSFLFYCGGKPQKIEYNIDDIPVTELPIGWNSLNLIDSIECTFDDNNLKMLSSNCDLELDTANKYGLNNMFAYNRLFIENKDQILRYSLMTAKEMIFAKRLPDIGGHKVLIYCVRMQKEVGSESYNWILLKVNKDKTVVNSYIICGIDWKESDFMTQFFYCIDQNYILTIREFAKEREDEEDDETVQFRGDNYWYVLPETIVTIDLKNDN